MKVVAYLKKHWMITSLALLFVLFFVVTFPKSTGTDSATPAASTPAVKANHDDVQYQVVDVRETKEIEGKINTLKTDGKFVIVTVSATNKKNQGIALRSNMFQLVDHQNREFKSDLKGNFILNKKEAFFMKQIPPGLSKIGFLVFEVPKETTTFSLQISNPTKFVDHVKKIPINAEKM